MATRIARRLPGFRFEARAPQLPEALPRMDVAVFVGFAVTGPLHLPVAIEDFAQFTAIFGPAAPLAWDAARGLQTTAYLAATVQEFFRNGGRRCWIVRVASAAAVPNYFPLPGLLRAEFNERGQLRSLGPALAQARAEGSWSDNLRVSTALLGQSVEVISIANEGRTLELKASAASRVAAGDLLRLICADVELLLLVSVQTVRPVMVAGEERLCVTAACVLWFDTKLFASPPLSAVPATAWLYTRLVDPAPPLTFDVEHKHQPRALPRFTSAPVAAEIEWSADERRLVTIRLLATVNDLPAPGALVRVEAQGRQLWLTVQETRLSNDATGTVAELSGTELWLCEDAPPLPKIAEITAAERLSFELWARSGNEDAQRLSDLGFAPEHPRYWDELPTDRQFYQTAAPSAELAFEKERVEFWRAQDQRRFPLAGGAAANVVYFPAGMLPLPEHALPAMAQDGRPLERDGLAQFNADLFLDDKMLDAGVLTLQERADFLRYLGPRPRQLTGLHAALGFDNGAMIEEATIIAVPDAVQRGWVREEAARLPTGLSFAPLPHPEWWRFLPCAERARAPLVATPPRGHFLDCALRVLPAPTLRIEGDAEQGASFTLAWDYAPARGTFILEEATSIKRDEAGRVEFEQPAIVYRGTERRLTIYGRGRGVWYYRVRAAAGEVTSNWSDGVAVRVGAATGYRLQAAEDYDVRTLLAVQRALLRVCAARGDLLAVLAMPEHYRAVDAIAHVAALKSAPTVGGVRALGRDEAQAFSYGALYHPWLIVSGDGAASLLGAPPEGAAAGVLAARSLTRGAWIAPANEALRGVVALTPEVGRARRLDLQEAQINLLRQEPRGFLSLSADTLSEDVDLRPINVRRLLMLLRRTALRLGAQYVFEPNSDAFRRAVQRGFEAMLGELFARGAFAGATPATSFQVNADTHLNARGQEQGRFIVELKVAPALPLTFLTIRIVNAGGRVSVEEF